VKDKDLGVDKTLVLTFVDGLDKEVCKTKKKQTKNIMLTFSLTDNSIYFFTNLNKS
jgi:hypothetical protein